MNKPRFTQRKRDIEGCGARCWIYEVVRMKDHGTLIWIVVVVALLLGARACVSDRSGNYYDEADDPPVYRGR